MGLSGVHNLPVHLKTVIYIFISINKPAGIHFLANQNTFGLLKFQTYTVTTTWFLNTRVISGGPQVMKTWCGTNSH